MPPADEQPNDKLLPSTGVGYCDDGYDWIRQLKNGWRVIPGWGRDGWDLGSWPLVVVAHYDGPDVYGVATYVDGDSEVAGFATRAERDARTDNVAATWWRLLGNGPKNLAEIESNTSPDHRGPPRP